MNTAMLTDKSRLNFIHNHFQSQPVLYRTLATLPANVLALGDQIIRDDAKAHHELMRNNQQPSPKRQRHAQNETVIGNGNDSGGESLSQVFLDVESDVLDSSDPEEDMPTAPDETIRHNWIVHRNIFRNTCAPFTTNQCNAIRLMSLLRQKHAPLNLCEDMMTWHVEATGTLKHGMSHKEHPSYMSKEKLLELLRQRYQIYQCPGLTLTRMTLPYSKARTDVVHYDAKEAIISLLTDPRITDDDYLFFGNDPFQAPPDKLNYVEDLNTGRAYIETYKKLITKPKSQILLPVIFYIDAANTGQFSDLPITAVKFTFGIFKRKSRDKNHFWRTLGYIPDVSKFKSLGIRLMIDSRHVDGGMVTRQIMPEEGLLGGDDIPKAQDMHAILDQILASYIKIQETGFVWDLFYQNKVYKNTEFVLFTPFFKTDTEEADKLCGKYTSRTHKIGQLCRYCECPTQYSDKLLHKYPLKVTHKIARLIQRNQSESLKNLAQHNIKNATYKLRFGSHNKQGIHGACPMEMLHQIQLGIFRYVRDHLFTQMGKYSELAAKFNALCVNYGDLLSRQSQRDMPKTKFGKGILKGKLTAKEYSGVLLCMAAALCSQKGRDLLKARNAFKDAGETVLNDWSTPLDTLLQWEQWLKSEQLQKSHVFKSRKKHLYVMYLIKKIARRTAGMGLKIVKYHAIMHMTDDILNFGVPMEFDTGSNEEGHKETKKAAKLTQKVDQLFDQQTAKRLDEKHLLDLAMAELEGKLLFHYGCPRQPVGLDHIQTDGEFANSKLVGAKIIMEKCETSGQVQAICFSRAKDKSEHCLENDLIHYVYNLELCMPNQNQKVVMRTELRRNETIFRANAMFRHNIWRDWVVIDWGEEGELACKIYGFIDLTEFPENLSVNYQGSWVSNGIYAIVEVAMEKLDEDSVNYTELFVPMETEVGSITNGEVSALKFYLADVEAFIRPVAVVPDIGGRSNAYFRLKDRQVWREEFMEWLEEANEDELIEDSDTDQSEDGDDDSSINSSEEA